MVPLPRWWRVVVGEASCAHPRVAATVRPEGGLAGRSHRGRHCGHHAHPTGLVSPPGPPYVLFISTSVLAANRKLTAETKRTQP